jgi:Uma2 family endonuclease
MATAAVHVSLDEYLNSEYEPDCEYIDGVLEDRNVGKKKHSKTQGLLFAWLLSRAAEHGYDALVEQRVRISQSRFRIPDICLVPKDDSDEVIQRPPALWIEILSPEDRWSRIQTKIGDVLRFGVKTIWIIDPYSREAWIATQDKPAAEALDGKLRCDNPSLELELSEILPEE